jgi:beta-lactamase regulating signal transducer with metallopeptidase domain
LIAKGAERAVIRHKRTEVKGPTMERLLTLGLANAAVAAVLAVGVAGLSRLLAPRPAWLHCLWLLVLLKLVTPPLFEIPIFFPDPRPATAQPLAIMLAEPAMVAHEEDLVKAPGEAETAEATVPAATVELADGLTEGDALWTRWRGTLLPWLGLVWLSGTAVTLVLAGVRIARFRWLLRESYPASEGVQEQVRELSDRLGLKRPPSAWWIDAKVMPMLWAVACRPRLIIPLDLWKGLSERQRSMLLAHELAHLRRGDHLVRLFELAVTALYWWHPVVWWGRYALRDAEEQCCDAWVVWAFPDEARRYAETLLDTVDFLNPSRTKEPLLACGFGRAQDLRRRLTMIMLGTTPRRLGRGSALVAFACSALLLPLAPSWAQKPVDKPVVADFEFELSDDSKPEAQAFAFELKDDVLPKFDDITSNIDIVVSTDHEVQHVQADSIDKAVELIKQRIDAIAKESGDSKQQADQIRALKQALGELEKARSKAKNIVLKFDNVKEATRPARLAQLEEKFTAEQKAQIDKARQRVTALRKELAEKRQQLADAQRDLAKLSAVTLRARIVAEGHKGKPGEATARVEEHRVLIKPADPNQKEEERKIIVRGGKPPVTRFEFNKPDSGLSSSDRDRLDSLEKKLEKLLDEVASLKKH